jgi:hypothetical protein
LAILKIIENPFICSFYFYMSPYIYRHQIVKFSDREKGFFFNKSHCENAIKFTFGVCFSTLVVIVVIVIVYTCYSGVINVWKMLICALWETLNSHKKFDSKSNTMCVDNKTKLWPVELFSIPCTIQGKRLLTAFQFCVK